MFQLRKPFSKNKIFLSWLFLLLFSFPFSSAASDNTTSGWLGTFTKKKFGEKSFLWAETQLRYSLDKGETNQILYRLGILRKLNPQHELGFLYAFIQSGQLNEHRLTLQHTQKYGRLGTFTFSSRARAEARFLEDSDDDAARFRFLIRGEQNSKKSYSLVFWNEVFLNITDDIWTGERTFDRNRLFIGLKKKAFDSKFEFGYLNQYIPRSSKEVFEHTLVVYFFF